MNIQPVLGIPISVRHLFLYTAQKKKSNNRRKPAIFIDYPVTMHIPGAPLSSIPCGVISVRIGGVILVINPHSSKCAGIQFNHATGTIHPCPRPHKNGSVWCHKHDKMVAEVSSHPHPIHIPNCAGMCVDLTGAIGPCLRPRVHGTDYCHVHHQFRKK